MLTALINKQTLHVLGVNSGTSIDSVDLAVCRVERRNRGLRFSFLAGFSRKFPLGLHRLLREMADSNSAPLDHLVRLDNALGQFLGRSAASIVKKMNSRRIRIDLIASHGQTIRHTPEKARIAEFNCGGTLQIGAPSMIAAATSLPVVADFRQAAVALGHEGAPITTAAMYDIFGHPGESRLIVNIGGMANYFYFPTARSGQISARDCGPGNSLSDLLCQKLLKIPYDKNGRIAESGTASEKLLDHILLLPFFSAKTISTGREAFGEQLADKIILKAKALQLHKPDIIATTAEITVQAIANRVMPLCQRDKRLTKLYLTGGGRKNRFMTKRLAQILPELEICPIDRLQIDGDFVEAAAYALMGEKAVRSIASDIFFDPAGRKSRAVLGMIVQPSTTK